MRVRPGNNINASRAKESWSTECVRFRTLGRIIIREWLDCALAGAAARPLSAMQRFLLSARPQSLMDAHISQGPLRCPRLRAHSRRWQSRPCFWGAFVLLHEEHRQVAHALLVDTSVGG